MRNSFTDKPKIRRIAAYDRHKIGSFKRKGKVTASNPPSLKPPRKPALEDDTAEQLKDFLSDVD